MRTEPTYPLGRYAATVAQHMRSPCNAEAVHDWLLLCAYCGGWREFPGGFVAWFRVDWPHIGAVRRKDLAAVASLPLAELQTGPVLVVAECLALERGVIHREVRQMIRDSGCEAVAAWRDEGTRWKLQRVRHELRQVEQ